MRALISAFFRGLSQLSDPRTRSVVWVSIGWSTVIFIATWVAIWFILKVTTFIAIGWLEVIFDFVSGFGAIFLAWFLFPPVVIAVGGLLLERVVDAVEARHYPDQELAAGQKFSDAMIGTLALLGKAVGLNLLCLPLLLVPFLFPFVYYPLNGYLLSREYFEVVATRRMNGPDARRLRAKKQTSLTIIGAVYAFMLTIPLVNLLTPVIATAAMVHLFERWREKSSNGNGLPSTDTQTTTPTEVSS